MMQVDGGPDAWSAFGGGDDDDKSADSDHSASSIPADAEVVAQQLSLYWMQSNSRIKLSQRVVGLLQLPVGPRQELLNGDESEEAWAHFLHSSKGMTAVIVEPLEDDILDQELSDIDVTTNDSITALDYRYDAVAWLSPSHTTDRLSPKDGDNCALHREQLVHIRRACDRIAPGGCLLLRRHCYDLITASRDSIGSLILDDIGWKLQKTSEVLSDGFVVLSRRTCRIQHHACRWLPSTCSSPSAIAAELCRLESAAPAISIFERQQRRLTETTRRRAVEAMKKHGYCVLAGLVSPSSSLMMGKAALEDLHDAARILKKRYQVDLFQPLDSVREPASYRELSMREDYRLDLRQGPALQRTRRSLNGASAETNPDHKRTIIARDVETCDFLRGQSDILDIVRRVMNPVDTNLFVGNMGRYNFSGTGPDGSFQDLVAGPVGSIVSLPGAADQAMHADTAHLFEHVPCLPAHYINAFTPGNETPDSVGQTAFIHGSHALDVTAEINNHSDDDGEHRAKMWKLLVRPQLQVSDVLLFDCRILHFGLANTSLNIERPLLYTNMTMHWFHDPKNWDNERPIFTNDD
jgi:hypothetical protein